MPRTFDLAARVARDSGFTVTEHQSGYTGIRENGALLLFALAPSVGCPMYWEIRSDRKPRVVLADGFGLASLTRFLRGAGLTGTVTNTDGYRRIAAPLPLTLAPSEYLTLAA